MNSIIKMFNIDDKLSNILARDNDNILVGGGKNAFLFIKLLVGMLLLITAIFIFNMIDYWKRINANIINVNNDSQCQIDINYVVDDVSYTKTIIMPIANNCNYNKTIDIYYYITNPNIIQLNVYKYYLFSFILIILSVFCLLSVI